MVLVIENEFFVRWNTARFLEDAGYVVVEAASGEEAIALCNSDTSIDVRLQQHLAPGSSDFPEVYETVL